MKNRTGYTLIELMVVLAIVGILFTTAMPFYSTLRQRAIGTEVKSAINQISELPAIFVRKAEGAGETIGRSTGAGFAKGFGWNILPPLAIGTGIVIGGLLLYSLAMRRIEPEPTYARR